MHATLEEAFGDVIAGTMMELFPPLGWGDIATRADLDRNAAELRGEMAGLRGEMRGMLPRLYAANLAGMIGVAGLVLAAARLG